MLKFSVKKCFVSLLIFLLAFCYKNVDAQTKCKRASRLHQVTCGWHKVGGAGCFSKYGENGVIVYGNHGNGTTLVAGDAFDCDTNGDGNFSERFYYLSELKTNSDYAVLIYYSNTAAGVAYRGKDKDLPYDSTSNDLSYSSTGPHTVKKNLPTTQQWPNLSLSNVNREIKDWNGNKISDFSYEGYSARLLERSEFMGACGISGSSHSTGTLSSCVYLLENTVYEGIANNFADTEGYTLENLSNSNAHPIKVAAQNADYNNDSTTRNNIGARPVIEVLKSELDLTVRPEENIDINNTQVNEKAKDSTTSKTSKQEVAVNNTSNSISVLYVIISLIVLVSGCTIIYFAQRKQRV